MVDIAATAAKIVDRFPERGPLPRLRIPDPWKDFPAVFHRSSMRSAKFSFQALTGARARKFDAHSMPHIGSGRLSGLHAALDELVLVYFELGRSSDFEGLEFERIEQEVEHLIEHHEHIGVTDDPFSHHDDPPAPEHAEFAPWHAGDLTGEWMTFDSEWTPHPSAPGRARWISDVTNSKVHVALIRHDDQPRPWLIYLHGAEMGRSKIDARILRAERLVENLGVNIAMPVLPKHGPRRLRDGGIRGSFPSLEMAENIHGLSQAIWDVRRVLTWVRTQEPTSIGVYGFSLGSNVASLLAALEPELDALVVGCPVADLVDLFVRNTPQAEAGADRLAMLYERAKIAHQPISPLHLDRVLPKDRIAMIGATADRLSDPLHQLSRLWEHWDQPEVEWVDGGHMSYILKSDATDRLENALRTRGVTT